MKGYGKGMDSDNFKGVQWFPIGFPEYGFDAFNYHMKGKSKAGAKGEKGRMREEESKRTLKIDPFSEYVNADGAVEFVTASTDSSYQIEEVSAYGKKNVRHAGLRFSGGNEMWKFSKNNKGENYLWHQGGKVYINTAHNFDEDPDMIYAVKKVVRAIYEVEQEVGTRDEDAVRTLLDAKYKSGIVVFNKKEMAKWSKTKQERAIIAQGYSTKLNELMTEGE